MRRLERNGITLVRVLQEEVDALHVVQEHATATTLSIAVYAVFIRFAVFAERVAARNRGFLACSCVNGSNLLILC